MNRVLDAIESTIHFRFLTIAAAAAAGTYRGIDATHAIAPQAARLM